MIYTWTSYQDFANGMAQKIDDIVNRFGDDDFDNSCIELHKAARIYKLANAVKEYALFQDLESRGMAVPGEADELDYIPSAGEIAEIDELMLRYPEVG